MKITAQGFAVLDGDKDSMLSRWCERDGVLCIEGPVRSHILPLIPKGGTVVDAGAAIGDHTIAYLEGVGPEGTVYAFEPNDDMFECLAHNCKSAICFNMALGQKDGWLGMNQDNTNAGASFLMETGSYPVKVVALDSIVPHGKPIQRLDLFKLDVEGMELEALKGAVETIRRCKPVLIYECNPPVLQRRNCTVKELNQFVRELGYSTSVFQGEENVAHWEMIARPI